jgi:uncharacterized protein (DUF433 family)
VIDFATRFVRDPEVCNGQTTIKGTRVMLRTVLASLAAGETAEEILEAYPALTQDDLRAAIAFAAASAVDDIPLSVLPSV